MLNCCICLYNYDLLYVYLHTIKKIANNLIIYAKLSLQFSELCV